MATSIPEMYSSSSGPFPSSDYMERLEELARTHGWSVDEALQRALDITEIVLKAKEEIGSKVYVYRGGKRYALEVQE